MPKRLKEDMLNIVKGKYNVGIMTKQWTISSIGKKWRGYKCEWKNEYYSIRDTDEERLANPPPNVEKEHWEFLVRHWGTPIAKEVSKKNKECRGKQIMMHTTETKSFARVSAEIEEDEGIQLSRADLFIRTHVNKDGKATNAATSEMIEEAHATRVELQETISKMQADYDNKLENLRAKYDDKLKNLQQQVAMLMQMQEQNCSGQDSDSLNAPPRVSPNPFFSCDANSDNSNQMGKKTC
ncbi:uncharacterized protein LOC132303130 isoform X2 [Cornus florida]|uniref:uncharacterized protein LOC132303130 isoform X2 n=1 Tax=Cornus florida TaxID=4283 RepID=UPI002896C551|nr:uncharacterized protein LOC132303130 isoform X2 [Cornus florida]